MNFLKKIAANIRKENLLRSGEKVLVGVSGGADSVALLLSLQSLGYEVVAAHCNFTLRGEESERDEHFVRRLCFENAIPSHFVRFDTHAVAEERKISIEMAARELRYTWFSDLMKKENIRRTAVAHHQEDNIETFFLHLVRGTGLRGLQGMMWRNGSIIRPLLNLSRAEIEQWLKDRQQIFMTDSTNRDEQFKRNKIRHRLLPVFRELNPAFDAVMQKNMQLIHRHTANVDRQTANTFHHHLTILSDGISLDARALSDNDYAEDVLFRLLQYYHFPPQVAEDMHRHLDEVSGHIYETPTHLATRTFRTIEIRRRPVIFPNIVLRKGDNLMPDGTMLRVSLKTGAHFTKERNKTYLDLDKISGVPTCRSTQKGDKFPPFGMKGSKLISDYLTDLGRSRIDRMQAKVICDDKNILALVGERTAQTAAVSPQTARTVIIEYLSL